MKLVSDVKPFVYEGRVVKELKDLLPDGCGSGFEKTVEVSVSGYGISRQAVEAIADDFSEIVELFMKQSEKKAYRLGIVEVLDPRAGDEEIAKAIDDGRSRTVGDFVIDYELQSPSDEVWITAYIWDSRREPVYPLIEFSSSD